MDVHRAARRHRVSDADITHAYGPAITWFELDDDPQRYLLAGPDRAGLLELVVLVTDEVELVIHAMPLRDTTRRELFGKEGRR